MNSRKQIVLRTALIAAFAVPTLASLAVAPARTFVASTGNDANACSRTAPCRTFGAAVTAVVAGGEVIVLDTAGYGPVTITKAVSIIAPDGIYAGVTVPASGIGVSLNTANTTDVVTIRGLTFTGADTANGIFTQSNCQLLVQKCSFTGFTSGTAIKVQYGPGPVYVQDCTVKGSSIGVGFSSGAATLYGTVENCKFLKVSSAVSVTTDSRIIVRDSSAYNCGNGFSVTGFIVAGPIAEMTVDHCYVGFSGDGLDAVGTLNSDPAGIIRVSNSTIVDNTYGFRESAGGLIYSQGNNTLEGNANNNLFDHFISQK